MAGQKKLSHLLQILENLPSIVPSVTGKQTDIVNAWARVKNDWRAVQTVRQVLTSKDDEYKALALELEISARGIAVQEVLKQFSFMEEAHKQFEKLAEPLRLEKNKAELAKVEKQEKDYLKKLSEQKEEIKQEDKNLQRLGQIKANIQNAIKNNLGYVSGDEILPFVIEEIANLHLGYDQLVFYYEKLSVLDAVLEMSSFNDDAWKADAIFITQLKSACFHQLEQLKQDQVKEAVEKELAAVVAANRVNYANQQANMELEKILQLEKARLEADRPKDANRIYQNYAASREAREQKIAAEEAHLMVTQRAMNRYIRLRAEREIAIFKKEEEQIIEKLSNSIKIAKPQFTPVVEKLQTIANSETVAARTASLRDDANYQQLNYASKKYRQRLARKVLKEANNDSLVREAYWVVPFPGPCLIEERPIPKKTSTFVNDINSNKRLKAAIAQNPKLSKTIEKYKAQVAVDNTLRNSEVSRVKQYRNFHQQLLQHKGTLKPRRDGNSDVFWKVVATVFGVTILSALSFGIGGYWLFNKLWTSEGERFAASSEKLLPAPLKRSVSGDVASPPQLIRRRTI